MGDCRFRDDQEKEIVAVMRQMDDFNLEDRMLNIKIRAHLKKHNMSHYNRKIFSIIYLMGGKAPRVSSHQFEMMMWWYQCLVLYF